MSHKENKKRRTKAEVIGKSIGQEIRLHCVYCGKEMHHTILAHVRCVESEDIYINAYDDEPVDTFYGHEDFRTLQCGGCRKVSIYLKQTHSEDYEWVGTKLFPEDHISSRGIPDHENTPENVQRVYEEAVEALDNKMPVLAGVGIRAIVETVCKDCKATGRNLALRINSMVDLGLITKDGAEVLHSLRILGNKAAHDVEPHKLSELNAALDVVDHLLQGVYTIPARAKELPKKK